jgi:hypothetical protein
MGRIRPRRDIGQSRDRRGAAHFIVEWYGSMSAPHPLKLVALAPKSDESLIPPQQQVVIFITNLGYICDLKPERLPTEHFEISLCSSDNVEDTDGEIGTEGIDALGQYDSQQIVVTLNFCRIARLCATQGFNREDVGKIVLMHELAHFVSIFGTNSGALWGSSDEEDSTEKEDVAQEATHLLLRIAGHGHLVQVFDALSQLCPAKYDNWRKTWAEQVKCKETIDSILKQFQARLLKLRKSRNRRSSIDMEDY